MRKSLKTKIYNIILFFLIVAFVAVGLLVFSDYKKIYEQTKAYKDIKEQCVSNPTAQKDEKKINWEKLYKINSDIVAWIDIPGTPVDYPVVMTKDSNYYLNHDIHKKASKYGCVFIDRTINKKPSKDKNLIIFAHNMGRWTDVMFSTLMKYEDKEYLKKHRKVFLYTSKGREIFNIVSVREVTPSSDAYHVDFGKIKLEKWISNAVSNSVVADTEFEAGRVKKILTLSTCTYEENRLVLHCIPEEK